MFLHVCVILSTGAGVCGRQTPPQKADTIPLGRPPWQADNRWQADNLWQAHTPTGRLPLAGTPGQADTPWPDTPPSQRWPLQWTVRILLECILD